MKHLKPGWGAACVIIPLLAVAVLSGLRADWVGLGLDLSGAALLTWLSSLKRRLDTETRLAAFGIAAVEGFTKGLEGGYEPVETPVDAPLNTKCYSPTCGCQGDPNFGPRA